MNKLKYFFAVDTAYVAKKLGLLVFPYTHQVSRRAPLPPSSCLSLAPRPQPPSFLSSFPPDLAAAATARTGKCSTVEMYLCPHDKTSTPLTSISPVSFLLWLGGTCILRHQRGEAHVMIQHLLLVLLCVAVTR